MRTDANDDAGPREPDPRVRMSLGELARIQGVARNHLTFSLTLACPLRCAHCIVEGGPDRGRTTMPLEVARTYAAQMMDLAAYGIRSISFTGGEPILASAQLRTISEAAASAGIVCGVVTAAHWATSEVRARDVLEGFTGVRVWDLSIDAYHEPFVPFEQVRNAYRAAKALGRQASVRFTYHDPFTADDVRARSFIDGFAEPADVCCQKIRSVGRGSDLDPGCGQEFHPWMKPCITQGMVVRYDGTLAPCCVSLVEERHHPFQLGDARSRPLREIHRDYLGSPLLQMIRTVGFLDLMSWLADSDLAGELETPIPDDVCDLCPRLFTNPRIAGFLLARVSQPGNLLRIGTLASRILGEHELLQRAVRDVGPGAQGLEGFEQASALAAETEASVHSTRAES